MYGDVGAVAHVAELPTCDFHRLHGQKGVRALYDGATTEGVWAFMCQNCFVDFGIGLGLGVGQRLVEGDISE